MTTEIQIRRGTATTAAANNAVLAAGEPGWDSTNLVLKIGDGVTHWNSLPIVLSGTYVPRQATAPDHTVAPAYIDTSTTPPVLKGWNGSAFVAIGGGSAKTVGSVVTS